ncbi:hypothetical protein [Burkholderia pyrrocinia]
MIRLSCRLWSCLIVGLVALHAAPSRAACNLSLSTQEVDYGRLTRAALTGTQLAPPTVSLDPRRVTVNVVCDDPRAMRLMLNGAGENDRFQFGPDGNVQMHFDNAQLDGRPVQLGRATGGGVPEAVGASVAVGPGQTLVPIVNGAPASGKSLSVQGVIETTLTDRATRVRQATTFDTRIRLQVITND